MKIPVDGPEMSDPRVAAALAARRDRRLERRTRTLTTYTPGNLPFLAVDFPIDPYERKAVGIALSFGLHPRRAPDQFQGFVEKLASAYRIRQEDPYGLTFEIDQN